MKMEIINLGEVLQEAVSLLQFEATSKQIKLNISKPDEIPAIKGCKDSLVQVFVNLILNGIQAVDKDGVVNIEASLRGNSVDIMVEDNGQGISEENLAHVFDPFFTTKPVGVGTGLGLSVSQGIVKQHDGKLGIVQGKIGFTSFLVSLPLAKGKEIIQHDKE